MNRLEAAVDICILSFHNKDNQSIADSIQRIWKFGSQDYSDLEKIDIILVNKLFFKDVWSYINGRSNLVEINNKKEPLKNVINLFFKPFINNANGIEAFIRSFVTSIFLFFIQGITLFRGDCDCDGDDVIYPNLGRPDKVDDLSCINACNARIADDLRKQMRNIWNCHLERLIYNEIYKHFYVHKNENEKAQVDDAERHLFETCFPLIEMAILKVDVMWSKTNSKLIKLPIMFYVMDTLFAHIFARPYHICNYEYMVCVYNTKHVVCLVIGYWARVICGVLF